MHYKNCIEIRIHTNRKKTLKRPRRKCSHCAPIKNYVYLQTHKLNLWANKSFHKTIFLVALHAHRTTHSPRPFVKEFVTGHLFPVLLCALPALALHTWGNAFDGLAHLWYFSPNGLSHLSLCSSTWPESNLLPQLPSNLPNSFFGKKRPLFSRVSIH